MPLKDVKGQSRAIEALRRALRADRLHHAYLFAGPGGVGKGQTAMELAGALLCPEHTLDGDACGRCVTCGRVARGQHPDLHVIERQTRADGQLETFIRIDQVRDLQRRLSFKAYEAGRRVVVIRDAHLMNPATANALLKTLEEPGSDTHFMLVTHAPQLLLPTIISRCQRVRFSPLPRQLVAQQVARASRLDAPTADLVAGLAEGSVSKGIELAKSRLMGERADLIRRADPPEGLHRVNDLLDLAEQLGRSKTDLPMVFQLLRAWFRDLLLVHQGLPDPKLVHRDLAAQVHDRAAELTVEQVLKRLELLNQTEDHILYRSANARIALESMLLQFATDRGRRRPVQVAS